jgi:acetyl-CoA carboxylase biotin carboxylase subunit
VEAIGVYSDVDEGSPALELMHDAVHLPGAAPQETYVNQELVLGAAVKTGAEALHPGYGFLSEHTEFVEKCEEAGIRFIGPSSHHIALMGEKRKARDTFEAAGFPVVPRYHVDESGLEARAVYPVMVKAAAGGGGIGMTLVHGPEEVERALKRVSQAGARFFGSDAVYAERYLAGARHVEIQVAGDGAGHAVQLGERDCSWQRRYQKVIEESPAPNLAPGLAARMAEHAAGTVAKLGYENVGTVECLVLDDEYFFLEMNTRIQVEHAVTEMVRGVDLVRWQLLIASGEGIPAEGGHDASGHAIEFRVYAEDPRTFIPSPGTLESVSFPAGNGIRVDTAVRTGSVLSPFYDPMIAKIVAHGANRVDAIERARAALRATVLEGVKTNLPFLIAAVDSTPFVSGVYDTGSLGTVRLDPI